MKFTILHKITLVGPELAILPSRQYPRQMLVDIPTHRPAISLSQKFRSPKL